MPVTEEGFEYQVTPSGRFKKQLRDPTNPSHRITLTRDTLADLQRASEHVLRVRADVRHGETTVREAKQEIRRRTNGVLTVDEVWERYISTRLGDWANKARSYWGLHLTCWHGKSAWDADETSVRTWVLELGNKGLKPKTISNIYACFRAAYQQAVEDQVLDRMPWKPKRVRIHVPVKEREATRSWDEMQALIRAASAVDLETLRAKRFADLAYRLTVLALCGLRQGEGCGLSWDRVSIDGGTPCVRIDRQVKDGWRKHQPEGAPDPQRFPPKGKKVRTIALTGGALEALRAQRELLRRVGLYQPDGPVFPRWPPPASGDLWRTHACLIQPDTVRRLVERAGLPHVEAWVTHSLRHSFASLEVLHSGGDVAGVAARTGHSKLKIAADYMHPMGRGRLAPSFLPALAPGTLRGPTERLAEGAPSTGTDLPACRECGVYPTEPGPCQACGSGLAVPARADLATGTPIVREEAAPARPPAAAILDALDELRTQTDARLAEAAQRRALAEQRKREQDRTRRRHGRSAFEPSILAWIRAGRPGKRPPAITDAADRAWDRVFKAAMREGLPADKARQKARGARNQILVAFGKVLRRLEGAAERERYAPQAEVADLHVEGP